MNYISHAIWPKDAGIHLGNEDNESTDTHGSREAAEAVCQMLEDRGFGGDGNVFPVKTWVTPESPEVHIPEVSSESISPLPLDEAYEQALLKYPTPQVDSVASDGWSGDAICVDDAVARRLERQVYYLRDVLKVADDRLHLICGTYMAIDHGDLSSHLIEAIRSMGPDMNIVHTAVLSVTPRDEIFQLPQRLRDLIGSWKQRIEARNNISWNERDTGKGEQLQEDLTELETIVKEILTIE